MRFVNLANISPINVKDAPYNAVGDFVADDTAALQAAIRAANGNSRFIYLPNGTYKISDTLICRRTDNTPFSKVIIVGESRTGTIIKAADGAFTTTLGGTYGKALIEFFAEDEDAGTGSGNEAFYNFLYNLTVDTGVSNPTAVACRFIVSNWGGIRNVNFVSESGANNAAAAIVMDKLTPGPGIVYDVNITNFKRGIVLAGSDFGMTFEKINIDYPTVHAIDITGGNEFSARNINIKVASTAITPIISRAHSFVVLVDSSVLADTDDAANRKFAFDFTKTTQPIGYYLLKNVRTKNYTQMRRSNGTTLDAINLTGNFRRESTNRAVTILHPSGTTPLSLPIEELPDYTKESWYLDDTQWQYVGNPTGGDDTTLIQNALNSGKAVIYFRTGAAYSFNRGFVIPDTVKLILGFGAVCNMAVSNTYFNNSSRPKPIFTVDTDDTSILWIDHLRTYTNPATQTHAAGARFMNFSSSRTLVLSHLEAGRAPFVTTPFPGKERKYGTVHFFDYAGGHIVVRDQKVFARQLDLEHPVTKVDNIGATFWCLGLKTENTGLAIRTRGRGMSELFGGHIHGNSAWSSDAFEDSSGSLVYLACSSNGSQQPATTVRSVKGNVALTKAHESLHGNGFILVYSNNRDLTKEKISLSLATTTPFSSDSISIIVSVEKLAESLDVTLDFNGEAIQVVTLTPTAMSATVSFTVSNTEEKLITTTNNKGYIDDSLIVNRSFAGRFLNFRGTTQQTFQIGLKNAGNVALILRNAFLGRLLANHTAIRDWVLPDKSGTLAITEKTVSTVFTVTASVLLDSLQADVFRVLPDRDFTLDVSILNVPDRTQIEVEIIQPPAITHIMTLSSNILPNSNFALTQTVDKTDIFYLEYNKAKNKWIGINFVKNV